VKAGHYGDFDADITAAVLEEAGRFASGRLGPLNRVADEHGITLDAGRVTTGARLADGLSALGGRRVERGVGAGRLGGQGLPLAINAACTEIWSASNIAFGLCPLLTLSAIGRSTRTATDALKTTLSREARLRRMTGTMQLTERRRVRRRRAAHPRRACERRQLSDFRHQDFITYGDHDMTETSCNFVLARLCPMRPPGTKAFRCF